MGEIALEERTQYQTFATQYDSLTMIPSSILETQLVDAAIALMDVKGKTVLDLGGGTALHARRAIDAGAEFVDLVDISSEMIKIAQATEEKLGRRNKIRFFLADATQDLASLDLGLQPQYDIVLVGWLLDHSTCNEDLEAFWRNIAAYTKPGGSFMNVRAINPFSAALTSDPKYGVEHKNIRDIPGGVAVQVHVNVGPPFNLEATIMERMCNAESAAALYEQYGFENARAIDPKDMEIVKKDLAYWDLFLKDPPFCCVVARKR